MLMKYVDYDATVSKWLPLKSAILELTPITVSAMTCVMCVLL